MVITIMLIKNNNEYKIREFYLRDIKQIFNSDFFPTRNLHECYAGWSVFILRNPKSYHVIGWWPGKIPGKNKAINMYT